jgi:hypothetical protein
VGSCESREVSRAAFGQVKPHYAVITRIDMPLNEASRLGTIYEADDTVVT